MSFGYQVLGFGGSGTAAVSGNDNGIFAYGYGPATAISNLVSDVGVVATDVTGVGTPRQVPAACEWGGDKGIFGFGLNHLNVDVGMTNLVSNAGVVATDVSAVGTARQFPMACSYGGDKGIFGFGEASGTLVSITNLVSNAGVVASDTTGVGYCSNWSGITITKDSFVLTIFTCR